MSSVTCSYTEEELIPLALGHQTSDFLQVHVAGCSSCQHHLQQLQSESSTLRKALERAIETVAFIPGVAAPPGEHAPATIGKYFIVGILGQGAQATVYRAIHPVLHQELVIKYARKPVSGNQEERTSLIREGRILADLEHPNLARVIDLDFHEDRPFLVMEYHRGVNLEQFASRHKPSPRAAAALIAPLARALGAAHRRNVVHQDMKPANILIDETGKPYVLDFGLARLQNSWNASTDQPDGGTIAYMAGRPRKHGGMPRRSARPVMSSLWGAFCTFC